MLRHVDSKSNSAHSESTFEGETQMDEGQGPQLNDSVETPLPVQGADIDARNEVGNVGI